MSAGPDRYIYPAVRHGVTWDIRAEDGRGGPLAPVHVRGPLQALAHDEQHARARAHALLHVAASGISAHFGWPACNAVQQCEWNGGYKGYTFVHGSRRHEPARQQEQVQGGQQGIGRGKSRTGT